MPEPTHAGPGADPSVERLPLGLLRVGIDGTVRSANRQLADWVGQPVEALAGGPVDQLLTAGGRVLYHTYLLPLVRAHGQVQELVLALRGADGRSAEALVYAALDDRESPACIDLALAPMRERRRIESDLLRVQRAADSAPVVLFELVVDGDGHGRFPYVSAGVTTLLGLRADQLREDDAAWLARIHPDERAELLAQRAHATRARTPWQQRFRARVDEARPWRWHEVRAAPRPRSDGSVLWHGAFTDVTSQHDAEQAERARVAAEEASRAKSEFLARMSHELRTPLNAIIGFARLLASDGAVRRDVEELRRLGIVEASGYRLLSLINEVLDLSRIESGGLSLDPQAVALQPPVLRALQVLEPMTQAAALVVTVDVGATTAVRADAARLEQVLANLLSNAVKYNRPGGRVDVRAVVHDDAVCLEVTDSGIGLSDAQQRQLFQPFNRLGAERTRTEGTGLGLVITRDLVQAMGGTLAVRSVLGEGTTFSVRLPRAEHPPEAVPLPAHEASASPPPRRARVLYVEDDPVNALLMQAVLEGEQDIELCVASDAEAACRLAASTAPQLLLLDMNLPDLHGAALLARLRALPGLQDVPAVAVSADAMPEQVEHAMGAGFAAYWTKPLDVDAVLASIWRLLATSASARTAPR